MTRKINKWAECVRVLFISWWESWIADLTNTQYVSIQYAEPSDYHKHLKRFSGPLSRVFSRVRMFNDRLWTPFCVRVNPATLPVKRIRKLGRRWGEKSIWTY